MHTDGSIVETAGLKGPAAPLTPGAARTFCSGFPERAQPSARRVHSGIALFSFVVNLQWKYYCLSREGGLFQAEKLLPRVEGDCHVGVVVGEPAVRVQEVLVLFQLCWACPVSLIFKMLPLPKALSVLQVLRLLVKKEAEPNTTGTPQCTTASCLCAAGTSAARCSRAGWAQVRRRGALLPGALPPGVQTCPASGNPTVRRPSGPQGHGR